jgi:putative restriction endonuclease
LPFAEDGSHDVSNGMLLRSDFHKLFDLGLITVTPEFKIEISSRIKEEYYNGKAYYRLHGQNLPNLPEATSDRPNKDLLRWHNENRFQ